MTQPTLTNLEPRRRYTAVRIIHKIPGHEHDYAIRVSRSSIAIRATLAITIDGKKRTTKAGPLHLVPGADGLEFVVYDDRQAPDGAVVTFDLEAVELLDRAGNWTRQRRASKEARR